MRPRWETATGKAISRVVLGPVTEEQRKGITSLYLKKKTGIVANDLSLVLSKKK